MRARVYGDPFLWNKIEQRNEYIVACPSALFIVRIQRPCVEATSEKFAVTRRPTVAIHQLFNPCVDHKHGHPQHAYIMKFVCVCVCVECWDLLS